MAVSKNKAASKAAEKEVEAEQVIEDLTSGPVDEDVKNKVAKEVASTKADIKAGVTDPDVENISEQLITELKDTDGIDKGQSTYVDPSKKSQKLAKTMIDSFGVTTQPTNGVKPVVAKSLGTSDQNKCQKVVPDVKMFGDDLFKLLSKASSDSEGWMKSTKALDTGRGCLVQVTTQQLNVDGTYSLAEALTFVPGVKVVEHTNSAGEITGRTITGVR
jgi:hypothetical protein